MDSILLQDFEGKHQSTAYAINIESYQEQTYLTHKLSEDAIWVEKILHLTHKHLPGK